MGLSALSFLQSPRARAFEGLIDERSVGLPLFLFSFSSGKVGNDPLIDSLITNFYVFSLPC